MRIDARGVLWRKARRNRALRYWLPRIAMSHEEACLWCLLFSDVPDLP